MKCKENENKTPSQGNPKSAHHGSVNKSHIHPHLESECPQLNVEKLYQESIIKLINFLGRSQVITHHQNSSNLRRKLNQISS
jgi:hypothetical protein